MRFWEQILADIASIKERDPAAKSALEIFFLYPSFRAIRAYRRAHRYYLKGKFFTARRISQRARQKTGIEIHPGAKIGKGLFIDHGSGVVIGETAEIGDNCTIYQNVTLGGTGKETGKRHPTLGNNVMVGAGARVLGPFTVGDNVKIAANAVVLGEIPRNCTAVGVPALIVKRNGVKIGDLDQIHFGDPVKAQIAHLSDRIVMLEHEIEKLLAVELPTEEEPFRLRVRELSAEEEIVDFFGENI